jgi:hypothetical protein
MSPPTRRESAPETPTPSSPTSTADLDRAIKSKSSFVDKWRIAIRNATKDDLSAVEKSVAIEMSWYMNWTTGGNAFAGPARIARCTSLHVVTVKGALRSLVKKGWLTVYERGGLPKPGEQRKANKYAATYPEQLGVEDSQSGTTEPVDKNTTGSPDFTTGSPDFTDWESRTPPTLEVILHDLAPDVAEIESLAASLHIDNVLA